MQLSSASLPTLQIRNFSFCAHPGAVGGGALCLASLPVPGVLPGGSGTVRAGGTRGAEQRTQPGLFPALRSRRGVFTPAFFFLSHLQVGSQTGGALLLELSCTGAPLPPEQLALEMFVLPLLWATGQEEEQAALLAMQLTEMLWACHKQRGANLVPCWSWNIPPASKLGS